MDLKLIIKGMKDTYQIPNKQTVLAHGISVRRHLNKIVRHLQGKEKLEGFVPSWLDKNAFFLLKDLDYKKVARYALWHDLGKPLCAVKGPDH